MPAESIRGWNDVSAAFDAYCPPLVGDLPKLERLYSLLLDQLAHIGGERKRRDMDSMRSIARLEGAGPLHSGARSSVAPGREPIVGGPAIGHGRRNSSALPRSKASRTDRGR